MPEVYRIGKLAASVAAFSREVFEQTFHHPFFLIQHEEGVEVSARGRPSSLMVPGETDRLQAQMIHTEETKFDDITPLPDVKEGWGVAVSLQPPAGESIIWIGRVSNNDIVIDDLCISKVHSYLRIQKDGTFLIADLGSQNGTVLNGKQLSAQDLHPLEDLAVISLARKQVVIRFLLPETLYAFLSDFDLT